MASPAPQPTGGAGERGDEPDRGAEVAPADGSAAEATAAALAPSTASLLDAFTGYDDAAAAAAADVLSERDLGADARDALLRVVVQRPPSDPVLVQAMRALGATLHHEVLAALVDTVNHEDASAQSREVGVRTLTRLTGRDDLATPAGWRAWWRLEASQLGEAELRQRVGEWQTDRARRLTEAEAALAGRLANVYRRLYVLTPVDDRSQLLLELLGSPIHTLQELGYDLAEREALSSRPPSETVVNAALEGLDHEKAAVRSAAADFLYTVNAEGAAAEAARILSAERDPATVAGLLRILVRQPMRGAAPIILERLRPHSQPPLVVDAAVDAALEFDRAFGLELAAHPDRPDDASLSARDYVEDALLVLRDNGISANGVTLLAQLAGPENVVGLLRSNRLPVAQAAARALDDSPQTLTTKIEAAAVNPGLFELVGRSLIRHRPTAEGYAQARALPASTAGLKESLLLDYAAALPPAELLVVAKEEAELTRRGRILERAVNEAVFAAISRADDDEVGPGAAPADERDEAAERSGADGEASNERETDRAAALELVRMLTATRLNLKNPTGVVTLLERAPASVREQPWAKRALLTSFVWLNRLNEAEVLAASLEPGAAIDAYLQGLSGATSLPHAAEAAQRLRVSFADRLSDEQARTLAEIETLIRGDDADATTDPGRTPPEPAADEADARPEDGADAAQESAGDSDGDGGEDVDEDDSLGRRANGGHAERIG